MPWNIVTIEWLLTKLLTRINGEYQEHPWLTIVRGRSTEIKNVKEAAMKEFIRQSNQKSQSAQNGIMPPSIFYIIRDRRSFISLTNRISKYLGFAGLLSGTASQETSSPEAPSQDLAVHEVCPLILMFCRFHSLPLPAAGQFIWSSHRKYTG